MAAALLDYGTATLTNCTVSGNSVNDPQYNPTGSAVQVGTYSQQGGSLALTNCTVSDNPYGGLNAQSTSSPVALTNTIVAGNVSFDIIANSSTGSNNLIGGSYGGPVNGVDGNIVGVANAGLAPLGLYGGTAPTVALLPGQPGHRRRHEHGRAGHG